MAFDAMPHRMQSEGEPRERGLMTHTQTEREEIRLGATYDFRNRVPLLFAQRRRIVVITRYTNTRGFQSMRKNFRGGPFRRSATLKWQFTETELIV